MKEYLKSLLIIQALTFSVSGMIWAFGYHDNDKWFTRWALALVCAGFIYIGECINAKNVE